ncbi:MAG: hypothetical protein QOD39_1893 [Mycobacterium sp.]|jgi:hypothetical protein|nr:hypothetical protein [Mycobacterium sp.]
MPEELRVYGALLEGPLAGRVTPARTWVTVTPTAAKPCINPTLAA